MSTEGHRTKLKNQMVPRKAGKLGRPLTRGQRLFQEQSSSPSKGRDEQDDVLTSSSSEDTEQHDVLNDHLETESYDSGASDESLDSVVESAPSGTLDDEASSSAMHTHVHKGIVCTHSEYGEIPLKIHQLLINEGIPFEMAKHLTLVDLRVLDPTVTMLEYCLLKEQVASRKRSLESLPEPAKRQDLKMPSRDGLSQTLEPGDPFKGFIKKVPVTYPAALPEFNSSSKGNPDFWFQSFENTLKSLQYHPVTWTALLRMAVAKDAGVSLWVQTLAATRVVEYDTLKRHLIGSFQTPVQAEKAYKELLRFRMKPNDRSIQAALDYNAGFGMHMLRANKTEESWPDWRYHYREGLEQPWKERFAIKVTEEGDPKTLPDAYLWLVGIGQILEAAEAARPMPKPLGAQLNPVVETRLGGHMATPEEVSVG